MATISRFWLKILNERANAHLSSAEFPCWTQLTRIQVKEVFGFLLSRSEFPAAIQGVCTADLVRKAYSPLERRVESSFLPTRGAIFQESTQN